jgi:CNT family concentrative nucleoside transporter
MNILWGIFGIIVVFSIAFLLSSNRKAIDVRTIIGSLAIQISFAFMVLKWEQGKIFLDWLTKAFNKVINYATEGINFLFGGLFSAEGIGFIFAIQVLSIVIFFSSFVSVLYYLGIMQKLIKIIGGPLSKILRTSKAETMSAVANIFLGTTEAPLVVRPYLAKMTQSELFSVMTVGLASVAGSVLGGYALMGVPLDYLLAASFMSAPAGLAISKIMIPETEKFEDSEQFQMEKDMESTNLIDAAARGASVGLKLAANIGAMLLAFIALVALINGVLGYIGGFFHYDHLSLEKILGFLFAPIAFAVGVPWSEAVTAGVFLGQKLVLNEFVAYASFAPKIPELSEKTVAIVSFSLCGFANISSLGILVGGLGNLIPTRRSDIAKMGVRSVTAGMLSSLLSASIAGMFM